MRHWSVKLPSSPPLECEVYAHDEDDALALAADQLGIYIAPCCELGDDPCPRCMAEARAEADDRAVDRARDEAALREMEGR